MFRENPLGDAVAVWTPGSELEGFHGIVHGGVVATVLDEAMSKALIFSGREALTAELRIRYRRTVRPGMILHVRGWIASRSGRLSGTESSITDIDGSEYAHAWASFLSPRVMRAAAG